MTSCSHFSHNHHIVATTSSHRLWQSSYHEIKKSARAGSNSVKLKKYNEFMVLNKQRVKLIFGGWGGQGEFAATAAVCILDIKEVVL